MYKRYLIRIIAIVSVVMCISPAFAKDNWFIAGNIGNARQISNSKETNFDFAEFEFDDGKNYSISAGRTYGKFSFELQISIRNYDANHIFTSSNVTESLNGSQYQTSLLANGYYKLFKENMFTPYHWRRGWNDESKMGYI